MNPSDSFVRNCIFSEFFFFCEKIFLWQDYNFPAAVLHSALEWKGFFVGFFVCFVIGDVFNIQLFAVL